VVVSTYLFGGFFFLMSYGHDHARLVNVNLHVSAKLSIDNGFASFLPFLFLHHLVALAPS